MAFTIRHYALMYAYFAKNILVSDIPNSFDVLKSATRRYGYERGSRMAKRAVAAGDTLDFISFVAYTEWKPPIDSEFSADVLPDFPVYTVAVSHCEWYNVWREYQLDEYCQTYCNVFETALIEGFNPELDLKLPRTIGMGDSSCVFIYNGLSFNRSNLKKLMDLQDKLGSSCICSWETLTAHMYDTISRELIRVLGHEKASALIKKVLQQFGAAFSTNEVKALLGYEGTDFLDTNRRTLNSYV